MGRQGHTTLHPDSDDDGDFELLDAPPPHLKKPNSNHAAPIVVESSDDEGGPSFPRVRMRRHDSDSSLSPQPRKKTPKRQKNAAAGSSSRARAPAPILISDSEDERFLPAAPAPPPQPPSPILPKAEYLVPLVQELIPDADPLWVQQNLEQLMEELKGKSATPGQEAIDTIINMALDGGDYPRIPGMNNVPLPTEDVPDYADPQYHRNQRVGPGYVAASIEMLSTVFPAIPLQHIRNAFQDTGSQLVPAYQLLHAHTLEARKPYIELKKKRGGKGKGRAEEDSGDEGAEDDLNGRAEARRERAYLRGIMAKAVAKEAEAMAIAVAKEKAEADHETRKKLAEERGDGIECQCCFDTEAPEDTAGCPEGHLFCHGCIRMHAETKLGDQVAIIPCMDSSGCQELFNDMTLASVLSDKTMSLYHRLRQMKELELADIPGLESCPFCPFAMVIDNSDERLFTCLNDGCLKVTCRQCHRLDHLPKRCEEVEADLKLDKRHAVEEAMSEALMRKCPKCAKPYVKDSGCNKIYCAGCHTMSCYICQQPIKGYDHFDQQPGNPAGAPNGKCALWDKQEKQTDAQRIVAARDAAAERQLEDAANQGIVLAADDLRVDAPEEPPPPPRPRGFPAIPMERGAAPDRAAIHAHFEALVAERLRGPGMPPMPILFGPRRDERPGWMGNLGAIDPQRDLHRAHADVLERAQRQLQELRNLEHPALRNVPLAYPINLPRNPADPRMHYHRYNNAAGMAAARHMPDAAADPPGHARDAAFAAFAEANAFMAELQGGGRGHRFVGAAAAGAAAGAVAGGDGRNAPHAPPIAPLPRGRRRARAAIPADPAALLPGRRLVVNPFVDQPVPPLPHWQQRRLEQLRVLAQNVAAMPVQHAPPDLAPPPPARRNRRNARN